MATAITTKIDIPLVLGRLVPLAEFQWKGDGFGLYSDIGEWRSPAIPKPTESAVYAEWDVYLAEKTQADALRAQRLADFLEVIGAKADTALTTIDAEITLLNGSPTNAQVIAILKAADQRQKALIRAFQRLLDLF